MYEEKDAWVFLFSFEKAMPVSKENRVFQTCHTKNIYIFTQKKGICFKLMSLITQNIM